jgi:hypothetical protein
LKNVIIDNSITKQFNISNLVVETYPTMSARKSSNNLIVKVNNPSDSDEDIQILGFAVKG